MSFEVDFRTLLLAAAPVSALIGDRANWGELPAARPRPLVCMWNITRPGDYTMDGPSGLNHAFLQVDCWADSYLAALDVANAIEAALSGYKGFVDFTEFQGVFFTGRADSKEPAGGAPAQRYNRSRLDVEVWYSEFDLPDLVELQAVADAFHQIVHYDLPWIEGD